MSIIGLILIIIVLIIIVSVIAFAIRIVPQSKAYVVERIGAYNRTDRKSTRLNSSHKHRSRMPSSA